MLALFLPDNNSNTILYRDFIGSLDNPDGSSHHTDEQAEKEPNMEYSLNYKKTFQREGHTLSADVQYQDNTENSSSDLREQFLASDGNPSGQADLLQRSDNRESERNLGHAIGLRTSLRPRGKV